MASSKFASWETQRPFCELQLANTPVIHPELLQMEAEANHGWDIQLLEAAIVCPRPWLEGPLVAVAVCP